MQNESLLHYWKERIDEWHTHVKLPHTHPIPGFIANPKLEEVFWKKWWMVEVKRSRNELLKVSTEFYLSQISNGTNVSIRKKIEVKFT